MKETVKGEARRFGVMLLVELIREGFRKLKERRRRKREGK